MLVPLSHVTVPVLVLNMQTAGTKRSKEPLAGKPKLSVYPSDEYVHWDATPLRSVIWKVTPVTPGSAVTSGPCLGAGWGQAEVVEVRPAPEEALTARTAEAAAHPCT